MSGHATNPKTQSTHKRIEQMQGKQALLDTWERQPEEVRIREHDYLVTLKRNIRQVRMYIMHRADKEANI